MPTALLVKKTDIYIYDLDFLSAHEVAIDMLSYCSDLENADLDDVIRAIIRYRGY